MIFAIHSLDILTSMGVFLPLFLNKSDHAHKNVRKTFQSQFQKLLVFWERNETERNQ